MRDYRDVVGCGYKADQQDRRTIEGIAGFNQNQYVPLKLRAMWAHYLSDPKEREFGFSIKRFTDPRVLNKYAARVHKTANLGKDLGRFWLDVLDEIRTMPGGCAKHPIWNSGEVTTGPYYYCPSCDEGAHVRGTISVLMRVPPLFKCHDCGGMAERRDDIDPVYADRYTSGASLIYIKDQEQVGDDANDRERIPGTDTAVTGPGAGLTAPTGRGEPAAVGPGDATEEGADGLETVDGLMDEDCDVDFF